MDISDPVAIALISGAVASIGTLVTAIANVIITLHTNRKVDDVAKSTDGMKTELVAAVKSAAMQEGHTAGVAEEKKAGEIAQVAQAAHVEQAIQASQAVTEAAQAVTVAAKTLVTGKGDDEKGK